MSAEKLPMLNDVISGVSDKLSDLLDNVGGDNSILKKGFANTSDAIKQGLLNGTLNPEEWAEKVGWIKGDNGKYYAPKDDPYYDPSGFSFGKATPETQTKTDESGVQVQGTSGSSSSNSSSSKKSDSGSKFPKTGALKNVSSSLRIRSGAGLSYKVLGSIPKGGKPTILGESGNWAKVQYKGVTGWSSKDYLSYDKGGIMSGKGIALKDVITPEAVLSPEQTKAWTKLVDNLTSPMLANLIKLPKATAKEKDNTQMVGDNYVFNNVTVKANDIQEFIASIKGQIPIKQD